jgi:hypothetical protein
LVLNFSANVATILDLLIGFAIYIKSPSQVCWSLFLTPQDWSCTA